MIYKNPWITVREDRVIRPGGRKGIFGIVETNGGASIVAIDQKGYCYLTKEYGYAVGKSTIGVIGGGIEKGEKPLEGAKRELLEETGLQSNKWHHLGRINYFDTLFRTPEHLFLALDVRRTAKPTNEESKFIKVIRIKFRKAVRMAFTSEIYRAESIAAIFRAEHFLREKHLKFYTK